MENEPTLKFKNIIEVDGVRYGFQKDLHQLTLGEWIDVEHYVTNGSIINNLHYLDYLSLEHYCDKIKNEFIIAHTLYYFDTKIRVFNSKDIEYNFFNQIMSEMTHHIIDIDTYKIIARSDYWKNIWANNKHKLLDEPVNEWSDEQKTMFNISSMYDRVYEHPECPIPEIVEDNDALDGWMIAQKRENDREKKTKGVDNMLTDKIKNSSEIFMMAQDKEQIETIIGFNTPESLRKLNSKMNFVTSQQAPIREDQLPDVKQEIIKQLREGK
jgi:hypothetical protein